MPIILRNFFAALATLGPKSSTPTSGARQERLERRPTMFTKVREGSRYGACSVLGELVEETETRYFYRRHFGNALYFC